MSAHARLSPSAAHRWMNCPGSIRLTDSLPPEQSDTTNRFSQEGTLAHEAAEIVASLRIGLLDNDISAERLDVWRRKVEAEKFDADEMLMHAAGWADSAYQLHRDGMVVELERRVATGVPQSWGTGDLVAYEPGYVEIRDFKYGKGVAVHAEDNPQLMLYGLGVLEQYAPQAREVAMTIWQPRIDNYSTHVMLADDLRQWRDAIALPAARLALTPDAPIVPSLEACQFCPASGSCLVRSNAMMAQEFGDPDLMTEVELAETLERLDDIEAWASAVRAMCLRIVKNGQSLPGFKLVRKRGQRKISDTEAVMELLGAESVRTSLRPLGELEKLVGGKKALNEKLGDLIRVAEGSEVLVPESDPRPESTPFADFME